jgi:hypothetical protein
MSWSLKFDEPTVLSNGRKLVTLKDAGAYIAKLPKAEHDAPEWRQHGRRMAIAPMERRAHPSQRDRSCCEKNRLTRWKTDSQKASANKKGDRASAHNRIRSPDCVVGS